MARRSFPWFAVGAWLMALSVVLAVAPLVVGIVGAPIACGPDANEGNCSLAVVPWLTFFTAPIGALGFLVGGVLLIVGAVRRKRASGLDTAAE